MADDTPQVDADDFSIGVGQIRDAAKWIVAAFAAIGAALIAGSQLSSIGKLEVSADWGDYHHLAFLRLPVAILGAVVGLGSVAWIIWNTVSLLAPRTQPLSKLVTDETMNSGSPVIKALRDAGFIGTDSEFGTLAALKTRRDDTLNAWKASYAAWEAVPATDTAGAAQAASDSDVAWTHANYVEERVGKIEDFALFSWFSSDFAALQRRAVYAAGIGAVGIVLFAWAANPATPPAHPPATLAGADLRFADLEGANLQGADLTNADLTGANLNGATLTGAHTTGTIWSETTCPDGVKSDDAHGSCNGHLSPAP
jgi:HAMP domain-containing protein